MPLYHISVSSEVETQTKVSYEVMAGSLKGGAKNKIDFGWLLNSLA